MVFSNVGFIIAIFYGIFIYLHLIREPEIIEACVFSVGLGFWTIGILLFTENISFKISFGFLNALIILFIFLIIERLKLSDLQILNSKFQTIEIDIIFVRKKF